MGPSFCGRGEFLSEFIRNRYLLIITTYLRHSRTYKKSKNEKCPPDSVHEAKGLAGFATVYILHGTFRNVNMLFVIVTKLEIRDQNLLV